VCAGSAVSHSQLPTDPPVAALVAAELSAGPARPFGAADCGRLSAAG